MSSVLSPFLRATLFSLLLAVMGALLLLSWPGFVRAQDAPAADCGSGPNVACPDPDDPSAQYIGSVTALPDGIVILLTNDGLDKARDCGGPETIAALAQSLYASIPIEERAEFQLDWSSATLMNEIYGHAFLNRLSEGIGAFGGIYERSNPINIVFADYGGPGQMTTEARAEQATFAGLGAIHRAAC
ncbi:MAG: hypothetical protein R2855_18885 [Thermomicrobiales bacterium]